MSTPQDILSQILQGGLLDYSQPQVNSGLLGGNPNMNLGLSLLANSNTPGTFGALLGKSALETQQRQQSNAANQMQLLGSAQDLRMNMMQQQAMQEYMKRIAGGQQQAPQDPAQQQPQQTPQQFIPGISQMPQQQTASQPAMGQPQAQVQTSQQPTMFGASSDIAATPINGMSPDMYRLYNAAMKKDPLETEKALRATQVAAAQDQVRPQLDAADTLINSDRPAQYAQADPRVMAVWQQTAPRLGMNPQTDFNDQNVRTAIAFARNEAASRVNLPVVKPTAPMKTIQLPDGRTAQVDPITGKMDIESAGSLVKVVGKDGKPVYVPEGKAAGMRPYNEMTAASDEALQATADDVANYKLAPPSGSKLLSGNWPEVMKLVKSINPGYDATQYAMKAKARLAFAAGKQGDIVRSLSVATDHLDQLSQAADALKNGGIPAANKIANFFSQQTGNAAVTNFNAMKEIVGDEVVKAVVGATGASGDREAIKKTFSAANSPQQLAGVIQKYKGLMGGQLKGLRQQYERTTGLKDFDTAVSETAKEELGGAGGLVVPPNIQALLDKHK